MTPKPQEVSSENTSCVENAELPKHRVVISGMAGLYPDSNNVKDLEDILYNKVNPVITKEIQWVEYNHPEVAPFVGQIPNLDTFDAQFFMVHNKLAHSMDPMARKILEQAYQAVYDAGVCPAQLNGMNVGVFVGAGLSETEKTSFYVIRTTSSMSIAGCSKSMFANRISYWLNAKGPSLAVDQGGCSSTMAIELAYDAIRRGECDAAIVCGANICLHPQSTVHYRRINKLNLDGKTKSFSADCNGSLQSEAINSLFLQKPEDAKRIYAEVVHVKSEFRKILVNDTGLMKFGFYRELADMTNYIKSFYEEANVNPEEVEYVEAVGSAIDQVDKTELEAISNIYCQNKRDKPLLVGSVMSNIGDTEAASGITAVTKMLLAYQKGYLAGNLHGENIREDVESLNNKRMEIVTDNHKFNRGYAAINGLSINGVNTQILLKGIHKAKDLSLYNTSIPRLVLITARQESAVEYIFDYLKNRPIDAEELALLYNIHETHVTGHLGRGYTILDTTEDNKTQCLVEKAAYFDVSKKELWYVYSGMGSQWVGMGIQLMRIPIFAAAIERCHKVLQPYGIDLTAIITSTEPDVFDNIMNSFVGIVSIQIGLTDILTAIGLVPDKIIGHSLGELGCAYADGSLTAEQMVLSAYNRGKVSLETPLVRGCMAAVGLGYQQVSMLCPPEIEVACHNGPDSSTLSGPADKMDEFIAELTSKGIFARKVASSNIAYHSRYIADAGPDLLRYMKDVIKEPKLRSEKWLSTSAPQDKWDTIDAKYSSAEYHTNNVLNPVLFEEMLRLVPRNAICLEIAPHGLLQAILKRSLPESCINIPLTRRGHNDNTFHLLDAIGKIFMEGYHPKLHDLYPKVEFPVSSETPMLGHIVEWAHTESWSIPLYASAEKKIAAFYKGIISLYDDEYSHLRDHVINGKIVFPYASMLTAVWDTFTMVHGFDRRSISVKFHDVHLIVQPILHDQKQFRLNISLQKGSGRFEISHADTQIATGFINSIVDNEQDRVFLSPVEETKPRTVKSNEIYELLFTSNHDYQNEFRSIVSTDTSMTEAEIKWTKNWETYLDAMIQLQILGRRSERISYPKHIRKIVIDINEQNQVTTDTAIANVSYNSDLIRCGGVIMENFKYQDNTNPQLLNVSLNGLKNPTQSLNEENLKAITEDVANVRGATLSCAQLGNLESLQWIEQLELIQTGINVKVLYAGLNTVDVQRAAGTVPFKNEKAFGMDISGYTNSGNRVMGLVEQGAVSTNVRVHKNLLWPVPEHWSMEDAATVPLAYCIAFYGLAIKRGLTRGDCVLVHGGTGALGQAIISIALAYDCEVFATVSDTKKKEFLKMLFPQLDDNHITYSRDGTFKDKILTIRQSGCDFVFGGNKCEIRNASLDACGRNSIYLDTSILPCRGNFEFGFSYLMDERTYMMLSIDTIFLNSSNEIRLRLQSLLSEGIARGYVRPLTRAVYAPNEVTRSMKLLACEQHRGKVLVDLQNPIPVTKNRLQLSNDFCHVIVTDNNILGMKLAERFASRGLSKLLIVTSDKSNSNFIFNALRKKSELQFDVKVLNSCTETTIANALQNIGNLGTIQTVQVVVTKHNELGELLEKLQTSVKKSCPSLRNFAVIEVDNKLRKQSPLVNETGSKFIVVPKVKLFHPDAEDYSTDTIDIATAIEGIERALIAKEPTVVIKHKATQTHILEGIENLIGVEISKHEDTDLILAGLIKDPIKLCIVKEYLKENYNISYTNVQMETLTIKMILEVESMNAEQVYKDTTGLDTFITIVDPEELNCSVDISFLPTMSTKASLREDEFNVEEAFLCIVPGIEGNRNRFNMLCERLKVPTLVLQYGYDRPKETLTEMAERFSKILLEKIRLKQKFYILGYETGIIVALEIAAALERQGLTGIVFALGGSPNEILQKIKKELGHMDETTLQDNIIKQVTSLVTKNNQEITLDNAATWHEKIIRTVNKLKGSILTSSQYVIDVIETTYARIDHVLKFTLRPLKLRSQIILLQAQTGTNDTSIQEYSYEPVLTYQLKAPLAHSAFDPNCTAIVNRHFDKKLHEAFDKKNLCEVYPLNVYVD